MKQRISLVIPAFNEASYISECISYAQKACGEELKEIIVVDNASTDNTADIASKFSSVKVVKENKKGTGPARQKGLVTATGDFVAFIDADTRMNPYWIIKAKKRFMANEEIICLSGPYKYYDVSKFRNFLIRSLWWIFAPIMYRIVGYMILGGNFIAKRDALNKMGGFDSNIKFYGDDTDTARRLSKYGKVIFDMNFYIHTSGRRFQGEGFIKTNIIYALNFIWPIIFHKPYTKKFSDGHTKND